MTSQGHFYVHRQNPRTGHWERQGRGVKFETANKRMGEGMAEAPQYNWRMTNGYDVRTSRNILHREHYVHTMCSCKNSPDTGVRKQYI